MRTMASLPTEIVEVHGEASLDWVLDCQPPFHCFDEAPVYVECSDDSECTWVNPYAH